MFLFLTSACNGFFEGTACTDAGCYSGFELSFNAENDSLSLGNYEVHVSQENGQVMSCAFTLVDTGTNCLGIDCIQNRACDLFEMEVSPFGDDVIYWPEEEKVVLIFPQLEGALQITIVQDGKTLIGLNAEPAYEMNQPNGPGCDPTCFNAATEITLNRD